MLIKGEISKQVFDFIKSNTEEINEDPEKAMSNFANMIENVIYDAIKNADIIVQPGILNIATPAGAGSNATPINIKKSIV
jgi:hypothetical protein